MRLKKTPTGTGFEGFSSTGWPGGPKEWLEDTRETILKLTSKDPENSPSQKERLVSEAPFSGEMTRNDSAKNHF